MGDLSQAATLLTDKQGHRPLFLVQMFQFGCMVNKEDSLNQMPT